VSAQKNARVVITGIGGPEVLKWVEEALPEPGPGQVCVKVLATGAAFADVLMRRGLYPGVPLFPFAPGYDIVGDMDAVGESVRNFALGLMRILPDGKKATWYNVRHLRDEHPEWFREDLSKLFELLSQRQIQPLIAARLSLREAPRANEMLEKSQVSGKLVLLPQE
jgi:NADPH:quinone reductase-like Zn-dependent oxidoreductase